MIDNIVTMRAKGGFGRNGTGGPEFRRLDRTSNGTLMLVNASFAEAAEALKSSIWVNRLKCLLVPQWLLQKFSIDSTGYCRSCHLPYCLSQCHSNKA